MRVALFQMNIIWENKKENLRKLVDTLETLGKKNVDLLLMPETSLTGFSMNTDITGEENFETVKNIKKLATQYGVAIGVECSALVPLGVGLGLALGAGAKYNKAIDIYNSKYDNAAIQLNIFTSPTGVGLALSF